MGLGPDFGLATKDLRRVTVADTADELYDTLHTMTLSHGQRTWPTFTMSEPSVLRILLENYKIFEPVILQALARLADPDTISKDVVATMLANNLAKVQGSVAGGQIAVIPVRQAQKVDRGSHVKEMWEHITVRNEVISSGGQAESVIFRTMGVTVNPIIKRASIAALLHLLKGYYDATSDIYAYSEIRKDMLRSRLSGDDPLGRMSKMEGQYLFADSILPWFIRLLELTTLYLDQAKDRLPTRVLALMNQRFALNKIFELLEVVVEANTVPIKLAILKQKIAPTTLVRTRRLLLAAMSLKNNLYSPMQKTANGNIIFMRSMTDWWTWAAAPRMFRVWYNHPEAAEKELMNGAVGIGGVKIDKWWLEKWKTTQAVSLNGMSVNTIWPAMIANSSSPSPPGLYFTESPAETSRSLELPLWDLYPNALLDDKAILTFQKAYNGLWDLIKLASTARDLRAVEAADLKDFIPSDVIQFIGRVWPLQVGVTRPPELSKIYGLNNINPTQLTSRQGPVILEEKWLAEIGEYESYETVADQTLPWNIN